MDKRQAHRKWKAFNVSSTRLHFFRQNILKTTDQIVQSQQVAVLVVSLLPYGRVVNVNIAGQWDGLRKVNHPDAGQTGRVVNQEQGTADDFVRREKGWNSHDFAQVFQSVNVNLLPWEMEEKRASQWLIDWLIYWVSDWLIDWVSEWLIDWLKAKKWPKSYSN